MKPLKPKTRKSRRTPATNRCAPLTDNEPLEVAFGIGPFHLPWQKHQEVPDRRHGFEDDPITLLKIWADKRNVPLENGAFLELEKDALLKLSKDQPHLLDVLYLYGKKVADTLADGAKHHPEAIQRLRQLLDYCRAALRKLVERGNKHAAVSLVSAVWDGVTDLTRLAHKQPAQFRKIANHSFAWPALISPHPSYKRANAELLELLEVGRRTALKASGRSRWSTRRIANEVLLSAMAYVSHLLCAVPVRQAMQQAKQTDASLVFDVTIPSIAHKSAALPKLTRETADQWFDVIWELVMQATGRHPERDRVLTRLGQYRADHCTTRYGGTQMIPTRATQQANIRDGIKSQLRRAFQNMLRHDPSLHLTTPTKG